MRLILYFILGLLIYSVIRAYFFPKKETPKPSDNAIQPDDDSEMVLDRICNTYFPKDSALRVKDGSNIHYFCSNACREKYLKSLRP
ncbi:MAG: hypothetical protein HZC45_01180 [Deltaproteobacteria bacterium]|nr:hypothetical protein [Deltaproteobacteria bacterium]